MTRGTWPPLREELPDPSRVAWQDPDTARWVKRSARIGAASLLLSVVVLIGTWRWVSGADEEFERVVQNGARAEGTVVSTSASKFRDHIRVRLDGPPVREVDIGVGSEFDYRVGQRIPVYYDPASPERVLAESGSDEPWVLGLAVIGGPLIGGIGLLMLLRAASIWRRTRRHPWRPAQVVVGLWQPMWAPTPLVRLLRIGDRSPGRVVVEAHPVQGQPSAVTHSTEPAQPRNRLGRRRTRPRAVARVPALRGSRRADGVTPGGPAGRNVVLLQLARWPTRHQRRDR